MPPRQSKCIPPAKSRVKLLASNNLSEFNNMASNRHLGRIIALQTLYEQEFRLECGDKDVSIDEILKRNVDRYRDTVDDLAFIQKLVHGVYTKQQELDKLLHPLAPEWPIDQIA